MKIGASVGVSSAPIHAPASGPDAVEWAVVVTGTPNWELRVPFAYTGQDEEFLLSAPSDVGTYAHTGASRLYYKFSPFGGGDAGGLVQHVDSDGAAVFVEADISAWYTTPGALLRVRCWNGLYDYPEIALLEVVLP